MHYMGIIYIYITLLYSEILISVIFLLIRYTDSYSNAQLLLIHPELLFVYVSVTLSSDLLILYAGKVL